VLLFFIPYLVIGIYTVGIKKLAVFTLIGYITALICEAISIRYSFPFGLYHYSPEVIQKELSIFGVPIWDSVSFVFLCFFPYQIAILLSSPVVRVSKFDFQAADTYKIRHSLKVILCATALMVSIDMITDPITLQGKKWFLGELYYYPNGGSHFGVPVSNYFGWAFTGFVTLGIYVLLDRYYLKNLKSFNKKLPYIISKPLLSLFVYFGIVAFKAGLYELGVSGAITFFLPVFLIFTFLFSKKNLSLKKCIKLHLKDFPKSRLKKLI
jgi:putative membrane protein